MKTRQQAEWWIRYFTTVIGIGFHPDTRFGDYVDGDGKALFSAADVERYDHIMEGCFEVLGEKVYDIGLVEQRKLLGF